MKVICLHHRLAGFTSHHFNEAYGLRQEFARRATRFVLLVNRLAPAPIVAEFDAHAVLDDPTFRLEWSYEERCRRFVTMLHTTVDGRLHTDDRLLLTIATQLEAYALTRWLQELPLGKKPWVVVLFISDRWNRSGPSEYDRQRGEFRTLAAAIARLTSDDAQRMIFFAATDLLARELTDLLGTNVDVAPNPLPYGDPQSSVPATRGSHPPRVAILGGTRLEKGSHRIPAIVAACRAQVPVEFVVQLANDTLNAEELAKLARIEQQPNVTVIRQPMTLPEYNAALDSADLALFPYDVIPYRQRTSGVFAEAVALGKPVVATRGTWMAEQIEAGRAAGTIFDNLQPDSIAHAIARCVTDLDAFQQSAQALSTGWRRTASLSTFVDLMEAAIADRRREDKPARRSWWWW